MTAVLTDHYGGSLAVHGRRRMSPVVVVPMNKVAESLFIFAGQLIFGGMMLAALSTMVGAVLWLILTIIVTAFPSFLEVIRVTS